MGEIRGTKGVDDVLAIGVGDFVFLLLKELDDYILEHNDTALTRLLLDRQNGILMETGVILYLTGCRPVFGDVSFEYFIRKMDTLEEDDKRFLKKLSSKVKKKMTTFSISRDTEELIVNITLVILYGLQYKFSTRYISLFDFRSAIIDVDDLDERSFYQTLAERLDEVM